MGRGLSDSVIKKLKTNEYQKILAFIINDPELSLDIRKHGVAMVYYKKSKILSLHSRKKTPVLLSQGYWNNKSAPILNLEQPKQYFVDAKKLVDEHSKKKNNIEFSIQQKIAFDNRNLKNEFVIIDMEYQFSQQFIVERTKKKTRFDLVAYNHKKNEIVLLELKQGYSSSHGKSGVFDHKEKFLEHTNHNDFSNALKSDVKTIIKQKVELGIIDSGLKDKISEIDKASVSFKVVFAYKDEKESTTYAYKFGKEYDILYIDLSINKYVLKSNV